MGHGDRLARAAAEVAAQRARLAADPVLRERSAALKKWQAKRLASTHADFLDEARHRAAARFFLDDLYGGSDYARRDAELARVIPTLTHMLPNAALATLADAVELDALTERLDDALTDELGARLDRGIDEAQYARAYPGPARAPTASTSSTWCSRSGVRSIGSCATPWSGGCSGRWAGRRGWPVSPPCTSS